MGRAPCCDKANVKKGPWSPEEDLKLKEYIEKHGTGGNWIALPHKAGLKRCGKSCRLRWLNYLRPNLKHGEFSDDEDRIICSLFASIGSRWSIIAAQLPGRTDNDIKNYWNTKLKKKLLGLLPPQRKPLQQPLSCPFGTSSISSSSSHYSTLSSSLKNPTSFTLTDLPTSQEIFTSSTSTSPFHKYQYDSSFPVNLQNPSYQLSKLGSLLMFGSEQSCSSSDGSGSSTTTTTNNPIAGYKDKYEDQMGTLSCYDNFYSTTLNGFDDNQKNLISGAGGDGGGAGDEQKCGATGLWAETPLEYSSIEEIKQLITSTSTGSGCNVDQNQSNSLPNFLNDGNVTRGITSNGRFMYF